jgi:hypothetical protein
VELSSESIEDLSDKRLDDGIGPDARISFVPIST